jgi:hypothetical protein
MYMTGTGLANDTPAKSRLGPDFQLQSHRFLSSVAGIEKRCFPLIMDDDEIPDLIDANEDANSTRVTADLSMKKVPITIVTGKDSSLSSTAPPIALMLCDRLPWCR